MKTEMIYYWKPNWPSFINYNTCKDPTCFWDWDFSLYADIGFNDMWNFLIQTRKHTGVSKQNGLALHNTQKSWLDLGFTYKNINT